MEAVPNLIYDNEPGGEEGNSQEARYKPEEASSGKEFSQEFKGGGSQEAGNQGLGNETFFKAGVYFYRNTHVNQGEQDKKPEIQQEYTPKRKFFILDFRIFRILRIFNFFHKLSQINTRSKGKQDIRNNKSRYNNGKSKTL